MSFVVGPPMMAVASGANDTVARECGAFGYPGDRYRGPTGIAYVVADAPRCPPRACFPFLGAGWLPRVDPPSAGNWWGYPPTRARREVSAREAVVGPGEGVRGPLP